MLVETSWGPAPKNQRSIEIIQNFSTTSKSCVRLRRYCSTNLLESRLSRGSFYVFCLLLCNTWGTMHFPFFIHRLIRRKKNREIVRNENAKLFTRLVRNGRFDIGVTQLTYTHGFDGVMQPGGITFFVAQRSQRLFAHGYFVVNSRIMSPWPSLFGYIWVFFRVKYV